MANSQSSVLGVLRPCPRGFISLERAQEVQDFLLFLLCQLMEMFDDSVCFAALAAVFADGLEQVAGASIVEEEDALPQAPEGSGAELVGARATLGDAVSEAFAHVVDEQVRVKIGGLIGKRSARASRGAARNFCAGGKRRSMAMRATNLCEARASIRAGRCGGSGSRRRQQAHEVGKTFDVGEDGGIGTARGRRSGSEIESVIGRGVEDAAGRFVAFLREELAGDTHLDVVSLPGKHQQGFVLRLPTKTRNGAIVAAKVHVSAQVRVGVPGNVNLSGNDGT